MDIQFSGELKRDGIVQYSTAYIETMHIIVPNLTVGIYKIYDNA